MELTRATVQDMGALLQIVHDAQALLAADGIDQWQDGYPNEQTLLADIEAQALFVYRLEGMPVAMAAILHGPDPDYAHIEDGAWDYPHAPYMVIHRVAVAASVRGKHIAGPWYDACIDYALQQGVQDIRVDTHPDNLRMQALITSSGFIRQGIVTVRSNPNAKRIAYALHR